MIQYITLLIKSFATKSNTFKTPARVSFFAIQNTWRINITPKHVFVSTFMLFIMTSSVLKSQTLFVGTPNSDWNTVTNWSNGLPAPANDAIIPSTAVVSINQALIIDFRIDNYGSIVNNNVVTLNNTLSSGGSLTNTLNAALNIEINGVLTSSGGFANSGILKNKGNVTSNSLFTNDVTAIVVNENVFNQLAPFINNGIITNNQGVFTCPQLFTNNGSAENKINARWLVDFGGTFINTTTGQLLINGSFQNFGTFTNNDTISNRGIIENRGIFNNNSVFINEAAAKFESQGTINHAGKWYNAATATIISSFHFNILPNALYNNAGVFQNNEQLDIQANATFINDANAELKSDFGSTIINAGTFISKNTAIITTNGGITNNKTFENYGIILSNNGAQVINTDTLRNFGTITNVNGITTSKYFKNNGIINNNSGGILTITGVFDNNIGGNITNNYEIYNNVGANFNNNGKLQNGIRFFNQGTVINNAFLLDIGDFLNKTNGILINNEVILLAEGSIVNQGTINNNKTLINSSCSVISNTGIINNSGRIENSGIIFQRGTLTGNTIVALSGIIHTSATSLAQNICRSSMSSGTSPLGEAKVYGQNPLIATLGIDECSGFQYFVDGTTRKVYNCVQVGQIINAPFTLRTRTGDSLTCVIPITVFDGVPPELSACPSDVTLVTTANTVPYSWATITATDNCAGNVTLSSNITSGSAFTAGTITEVVITARDIYNNSADCRFKVTVNKVISTLNCPATDVVAPIFTNCPTSQTINSNGAGAAIAVWNTPSVSDACFPIKLTVSTPSGSFFPANAQPNLITYTATDANNNVSTCLFNVTVSGAIDICANDNIKPIISNCPNNIFALTNTNLNGAIAIWKAPTATDNCTTPIMTSNFTSGSTFSIGTTTVIYTAVDVNNNSSLCSFNITINNVNPCVGDVTPPVFSNCPTTVNVITTTNSGIATWTTPSVTDVCGGISVNASHLSGNSFPLDSTFVIYTASDRVGNRSTCKFAVVVKNICLSDTLKPVLTACPTNISKEIVGTNTSITWIPPTATDNCSVATVISTHQPNEIFLLGATNVIYTATDIRGNSIKCNFVVTITQNVCLTDNIAPIITNCPTNRPSVTTSATCATVSWTVPTVKDNCTTTPSVILTNSTPSTLVNGDCFPLGTTTITYKAIDAKGNTSLPCTFTVTVLQEVGINFDPNKCYKIVNKASGKVIDVQSASTANFARIFQWTLHGGANQQWHFTKLASGFYEIKSQNSDKLLDIVGSGANCANGTTTEQYVNDNTGSQQWNIVKQSDNSYKLFNKTCNTKVLRVVNNAITDGANLELFDDVANIEYSKWFIIEIPCTSPIICTTNGGLIHERWTNRTNIFTNPIQIPTTTANSIITTTSTDFKMPVFNAADNYISRSRGYIKPTTTGNYIFNVTGDDYTELWLSTTSRAANIVKIAYHYGYTSATDYTKYATQTSVSITLQANQLYYVELRHVEGGGADFYQVQWKKPNTTTYAIIPSAHLLMPCSTTQQAATSNEVFTFDAKADINQTKLQWITNGGAQNDYFKVERIDEAGIFQTLDVINAHTGIETLASYAYTDVKPLDGENFYRIVTIPIEGPPQYSEIKKVIFIKNTDVTIFPNPAYDYIDIDLTHYESLTVNISILTTFGQAVQVINIDKPTQTPYHITLGDIPVGLYYVYIRAYGKKEVIKVVNVTK